MKSEAEHIAEGIREYVAKLNELLELAKVEGLVVSVALAYNNNFENAITNTFSEKYGIRVDSIYRKEIL